MKPFILVLVTKGFNHNLEHYSSCFLMTLLSLLRKWLQNKNQGFVLLVTNALLILKTGLKSKLGSLWYLPLR